MGKATLAAVFCIVLVAVPVNARPMTKDAGPDLPWPCSVVRAYAWAKGYGPKLTKDQRREIAAKEKANGITPKQHAQAQACFKPEAPARARSRAR